MIVINNIKVPVNNDTEKQLNEAIRGKIRTNHPLKYEILKKSIDARDKNNIYYVYNIALETDKNDFYIKHGFEKYKKEIIDLDKIFTDYKYSSKKACPIIVGAGPAGLFAALCLSIAGAKPIILERGKDVAERQKSIEDFNKTGKLDINSNVQFGLGGAGTFSDGKLTTGINSVYIKSILREFVTNGAPKEIEYNAKPHIGTDNLKTVVASMQRKIESYGGKFIFDCKVDGIIKKGSRIIGVMASGQNYYSDTIIFAIGHSARDTYEMLYQNNLIMEPKCFSMGVRIEHLQERISFSQYGKSANMLPSADYKAAIHLANGRSLYTFCMCPGGYIINASSEEERICVNGMSEYLRNGQNANSAILVGIEPKDFADKNPLSGIELQRKYEHLAYNISGSFRPPVQLYGDFMENHVSAGFGEIKSTLKGGYVFGDINKCLPDYVAETIKAGVPLIAKKIKGFDSYESLLTGIEARSSSPVRIVRNKNYDTSIEGLYAIGEGAGYAGGITSSAVDGIKCAAAVLDIK